MTADLRWALAAAQDFGEQYALRTIEAPCAPDSLPHPRPVERVRGT